MTAAGAAPTELGTEKIGKLLKQYAVPGIISQTAASLYNMVDSIYIGHIPGVGSAAISGLAVTFPLMNLSIAMGTLVGVGAMTLISVLLGQRNYGAAQKVLSNVLTLNVIIGVIFTALTLPFLDQILRFFGASDTTLPFARDYMTIILAGNVFTHLYHGFNGLIRSSGHPKVAMGLTLFTVISNAVLDPIFIFVLDLGVSGASLATAVSQCFGWCVLFWGTSRPGNVHIKFKNFSPTLYYYKEITRGGLPSLARQALSVVATISLNRMAVFYALPGNEASTVAAFTIVSRITLFCFAIVIGFGQGFQPVCGYNYGARLFARVKESYMFCITITTAFLIVLGTIVYIFAPDMISWFRGEDPELIRVGSQALRWQCIAFPLMGLCTATNMLFQNIGYTWQATLLSMCRQGLYFLPAVFVMSWLWGITGLEAAQAVADACTFLTSLPFAIWILKELSVKSQQNA